jgi:phosphoserine phosphatase
MKLLIILDLDHTLIYGSYAENETAELLFQHNMYLKVYKRQLAEDLVKLCQAKADIIVYTAALRRYAKTICNLLEKFAQKAQPAYDLIANKIINQNHSLLNK